MRALLPTYHSRRCEGGYTLVELLVAMLITMILGGTVFALYLAVQRWVGPWQREIALEDTMHLVAQRLLTDITYAEQLIREDNTYTLTYPDRPAVRYRHKDRVLLRNARPMHDSSLAFVAFALMPSRPETRYALSRRDQAQGYTHRPVLVAIHLALKSHERRFNLAASAALRRGLPWRPLVSHLDAAESPDSTSTQSPPDEP